MRGQSNHIKWLLCVLFLLVAGAAVSAQIPPTEPPGRNIIYVDDDADGSNTGKNWTHAVNSLQDALLLAYFYDKPVEIRVAEGIYTPDRGIGIMPGDKTVSFQLINDVAIKGGYAAQYAHGWDVRDVNLYKSILSGDLEADDGPELETVKENSYHVVTSRKNDATAVLDGFTITGSSIVGGGSNPDNHSSGMYNDMSSPTLIDCNFTGNMAPEKGAGMHNNDSNPVLLNCTFSENNAPDGGAGMYNNNSSPMLTNCKFDWNITGGSGAGMYNVNSKPALLNCIFTSNSAGMNGGGMYNEKSSPTLTNCTFAYNSARDGGGGGIYNEESTTMLADCTFRANPTQGSGGGIHNNNSTTTLLSCIFSENTARRSGGGLYNNNASETSLTNCIFSGNGTGSGGGMENLNGSNALLMNCTFSANIAVETGGGGISNIQDGNLTLVNCILWADIPDEIKAVSSGGRGRTSSGVGVTYCNVQNGFSGEGNIDVDPLFADLKKYDFHLKSQGGRWDPINSNWVVDEVSSPCIDAGSPDEPVGLERFPNGDRVNMGAYGGTPEASLSLLPRLLLPGQASNPSPADGTVDVNRNITLSWIPGINAVVHNVYFGSDIEALLPVSIQQATNEIKLETLDYEVTYYWRIDEIDSDGETITGTIWSFTTYPEPKGRACFTAETGVWASGSLVPISKVSLGQSIRGMNCPGKIQEVQEHKGTFTCYDVLLESENSIGVAENHYFLAESGKWISLKNLKAGIKLQTPKGSIGIKSVTKQPIPYVGKVYNLKVEGSDRYLVGKDAIIVRDY